VCCAHVPNTAASDSLCRPAPSPPVECNGTRGTAIVRTVSRVRQEQVNLPSCWLYSVAAAGRAMARHAMARHLRTAAHLPPHKSIGKHTSTQRGPPCPLNPQRPKPAQAPRGPGPSCALSSSDQLSMPTCGHEPFPVPPQVLVCGLRLTPPAAAEHPVRVRSVLPNAMQLHWVSPLQG